MPWTVKDVPRFTKKAKTAAQKKKWVSVANGVLKSCQASGGSNCEAKAIKIANSKFGETIMMKETKLPKGAFRFVDQGCHAHVEFAESGGARVPKLRMVAYSGGIIKGHWYWDNLAIDLSGMKFSQSKYPVLEEHMGSRKIAVIGKPIIEEGKLKAPDNAKFLRTEASEEFLKNSEDGFPYQSSIYAKPSAIERIEEGSSAEVNGFKMKGPGTIWRQCEFKEMSVCVFGWDSKTNASAFSRTEEEEAEFSETIISGEEETLTVNEREEVSESMNREELMEKYPDLIKDIVTEALSEAQAKFDKKEKSLNDQLAKANTDNAEMSDRVLDLEKKETLRTEKDQRTLADSIWTAKLSQSDVPSRLHEKVRRHVNYSKFMKDGVLDQEAFSAAVDAEVQSWEGLGVSNKIMGASVTQKELDLSAAENEAKMAENNSMVSRLVKLSGVKVPEKQNNT